MAQFFGRIGCRENRNHDLIGEVFLFDPSLREMMTLNMMIFFQRVLRSGDFTEVFTSAICTSSLLGPR